MSFIWWIGSLAVALLAVSVAHGRKRSLAWGALPFACGWVAGFLATQLLFGTRIDARLWVAGVHLAVQGLALLGLFVGLSNPQGDRPAAMLERLWSDHAPTLAGITLGVGLLATAAILVPQWLEEAEHEAALERRNEKLPEEPPSPLPPSVADRLAVWRTEVQRRPETPIPPVAYDPESCGASCDPFETAAALADKPPENPAITVGPDSPLLTQIDAGPHFGPAVAKRLDPAGKLGARPSMRRADREEIEAAIEPLYAELRYLCGPLAEADRALLFLQYLGGVRQELEQADVPAWKRDPWPWLDSERLAEALACG